jgi:IclR family mhp operon transcriptional activator
LLDAIRAKGYAIQDREINPKTTGIAVPIRLGTRVLGSLSLIWISSALTIEQAEIKFLPMLTSAASQIANAVRDRGPAGPMPAEA